MSVLDTNVLSEMMRATPDAAVFRWFAARPSASLWTTSPTRAELLHGVWSIPNGRRRDALEVAVDGMFKEEFRERVLAFTSDAAVSWTRIVVDRRRVGRPISHIDAQIAAIARSELATRNVRDFESCGIDVINPWSA